MRVRQVIEKLQRLDPEAEVYVELFDAERLAEFLATKQPLVADEPVDRRIWADVVTERIEEDYEALLGEHEVAALGDRLAQMYLNRYGDARWSRLHSEVHEIVERQGATGEEIRELEALDLTRDGWADAGDYFGLLAWYRDYLGRRGSIGAR